MEFLESIQDSVKTAVNLGLFSSERVASQSHIFNSNFENFPMFACKELENFNPDRLSTEPYPKNDRPRGQKNLTSVIHHRKQIRKNGSVQPIWIAVKNNKYILLDGAHRLVATYLEHKRVVAAYIVKID